MIIGITGGTGSGKTTLLEILCRQGALVLDCDAIYHELLQTDPRLLQEIERHFPGTVIDGQLNRKLLGSTVFSDESALLTLNKITHSAVREEVLRILASAPGLAAIDAIGLFEGGLAGLCDITVAVIAPMAERIRRLTARDKISEEYAKKRILAQHEDDWFREKCDYVLTNDSTPETFEVRCLAFCKEIGIM